MHNGEWTYAENAYCFIRLLEWRMKRNLRERDLFIAEVKQNSILGKRSEDAIKLHFDYLDKVVSGKETKIAEDKCLVGIYRNNTTKE